MTEFHRSDFRGQLHSRLVDNGWELTEVDNEQIGGWKDMPEARAKLVMLLDGLISGSLSTSEFCENYEHTWNFELKRGELEPREAEIFNAVFDIVVWYSPYPEDRKAYPGYKNEETILRSVHEARSKIV